MIKVQPACTTEKRLCCTGTVARALVQSRPYTYLGVGAEPPWTVEKKTPSSLLLIPRRQQKMRQCRGYLLSQVGIQIQIQQDDIACAIQGDRPLKPILQQGMHAAQTVVSNMTPDSHSRYFSHIPCTVATTDNMQRKVKKVLTAGLAVVSIVAPLLTPNPTVASVATSPAIATNANRAGSAPTYHNSRYGGQANRRYQGKRYWRCSSILTRWEAQG